MERHETPLHLISLVQVIEHPSLLVLRLRLNARTSDVDPTSLIVKPLLRILGEGIHDATIRLPLPLGLLHDFMM